MPFAFPVVPYVPIRSKFLVRDHINLMKSCFDHKVRLELLYVGRDHSFSSIKFHQCVDDKGPTISVAKSEHDRIFGFFTTVGWRDAGNNKNLPGSAFLFRIVDYRTIVKIN